MALRAWSVCWTGRDEFGDVLMRLPSSEPGTRPCPSGILRAAPWLQSAHCSALVSLLRCLRGDAYAKQSVRQPGAPQAAGAAVGLPSCTSYCALNVHAREPLPSMHRPPTPMSVSSLDRKLREERACHLSFYISCTRHIDAKKIFC